MNRITLQVAASAMVLWLSGCGGGGTAGSTGLTSTPPPPPPPPPPPGSVIAPEHIGLVSSAPFAVQAMSDHMPVDMQFSYNSSNGTYQISLPGFQPGTLTDIGLNGTVGQVATSTFSRVSAGSSSTLQPVGVFLPVPGSSFSPYTHTSFGSWDDLNVAGEMNGTFAYGIPTAAGGVPTTGSATYSAQIWGVTNLMPDYAVTGAVSLQFNFGGGTLSGYMQPQIVDNLIGSVIDFGRYDFTQTVYSTGSTTFSGKFVVPGLPGADSSFNGSFTGPNAAELMARFRAPASNSGQQGIVSGVWVGKKN